MIDNVQNTYAYTSHSGRRRGWI